MAMDILKKLTDEFHLKEWQVENTLKLIDEDNTIPFIARYRKELTGSLDDQVLRELNERLSYLRGLEKRKLEIISSIDSQGKLTDELTASIDMAITLAEIEDIYRPYKQKRKTRASVARERGLEPLAAELLKQENSLDPLSFAEDFINDDVPTAQDALNGAMDIIAEDISDRADLRKKLRAFIIRTASLCTKAADKDKESVYAMYYDFSEPVNRIAGHRVLAIDRGEREDVLKVSIVINAEQATGMITNELVARDNKAGECVRLACVDSFSRLIYPSLEREIRNMLNENASVAAIKVFSVNLRQLLMQPPVKGSVTLGLDPAYRTGCKIAVVDDTGKVLDTTVIYPTPPQSKVKEASDTIKALIKKHGVTTISIGNGTASRESESFVATLLKEIDQKVA